jgi:hypothetical protein
VRWLVICIAACNAPSGRAPLHSAQPIVDTSRACIEAATGLEHATKGLRPPEATILEPMRKSCEDDRWPADARECFTLMSEGDLGKCARTLADAPREAMFAVLSGGGDLTKIAIARAKLETLKVGVAECDQFVAMVFAVLDCDRMPLEARVALGSETADFWDLPTHGLSIDVQHRMANACGASSASLQQQASSVGCLP